MLAACYFDWHCFHSRWKVYLTRVNEFGTTPASWGFLVIILNNDLGIILLNVCYLYDGGMIINLCLLASKLKGSSWLSLHTIIIIIILLLLKKDLMELNSNLII